MRSIMWSSGIDQVCTTRGPRAKGGLRAEVLWPIEASRF